MPQARLSRTHWALTAIGTRKCTWASGGCSGAGGGCLCCDVIHGAASVFFPRCRLNSRINRRHTSNVHNQHPIFRISAACECLDQLILIYSFLLCCRFHDVCSYQDSRCRRAGAPGVAHGSIISSKSARAQAKRIRENTYKKDCTSSKRAIQYTHALKRAHRPGGTWHL